MICLQETWHQRGSTANTTVDGYESDFNSQNEWRGNGIATFYWNGFKRTNASVWSKHFQITTMEKSGIFFLNVYYKGSSEKTFIDCLGQISSIMTNAMNRFNSNDLSFMIMGDFNIDSLKDNNRILLWLKAQNLVQVVQRPTHIMGGLIDHVWITRDLIPRVTVRQKGVFFSDHDMITITLTP